MTHNAVTQEGKRLLLSVPLTGGHLDFPVHSRPQRSQVQGLLHYSSRLSWGAAIGPCSMTGLGTRIICCLLLEPFPLSHSGLGLHHMAFFSQ